jgi:hypothetical protein
MWRKYRIIVSLLIKTAAYRVAFVYNLPCLRHQLPYTTSPSYCKRGGVQRKPESPPDFGSSGAANPDADELIVRQ